MTKPGEKIYFFSVLPNDTTQAEVGAILLSTKTETKQQLAGFLQAATASGTLLSEQYYCDSLEQNDLTHFPLLYKTPASDSSGERIYWSLSRNKMTLNGNKKEHTAQLTVKSHYETLAPIHQQNAVSGYAPDPLATYALDANSGKQQGKATSFFHSIDDPSFLFGKHNTRFCWLDLVINGQPKSVFFSFGTDMIPKVIYSEIENVALAFRKDELLLFTDDEIHITLKEAQLLEIRVGFEVAPVQLYQNNQPVGRGLAYCL